MKHSLLTAIFIILHFFQTFALDHIILKDGQEFDVKLSQITNDRIVFSRQGKRSPILEEIATADVYMVYLEKQGNIYLLSDGTRITGEIKRVDPKKYDVIYLVSGAEIGAKNIRILENTVQYDNITKGNLINNLLRTAEKEEVNILSKSEVFMIRYKSGIVDIISPILPEPEKEQPVLESEEPKQPQFLVIFHSVMKGETLNSLAEKFNVSPTQIIEWNDLPSKIKGTTPLTVGMQLMIYQPKEN